MLLLLQVEEELKSTCKRKSLQLQEMGRRERLLKSDVDRVQGQVGVGWIGCSCGASLMGKDICGRQIVSSGKEVLSTELRLYLVSRLSIKGLSEGFLLSW